MHDHSNLINRFYSAFSERDADTMAASYTEDAHFSDPVFPDLRGPQVGAMWKMLCGQASDLKVEHSGVSADASSGRAQWQAWYTFSATGRSVHNQITARFEFRDGLICRHVDTFPLWRWTRMALGPVGTALGWSPMVQNKLRAQAAKGLAIYQRKLDA